MRRHGFRFGIAAGALLLLLTLMPIAAGATEIGARPGTANGRSAIFIQGNGFGPGEVVRITGYKNDGSAAVFPDFRADGAGRFDVPLFVDVAITRYQAVGQSSGLASDTIVGTPAAPAPGFVPAAPRYYYGGYGYGYGYGGYGYAPYYGGYGYGGYVYP